MSLQIQTILDETFVKQVEYHHTLGSTNDFAAQVAKESGIQMPLLVIADRQTAGRGRGAKRWWTGDGALAMSLLVCPEDIGVSEERSPLVALAVAVAVVNTVVPWLPNRHVGIHWPNDVFVREREHGYRKLAGILVEVLPDRRHVVGIGINTNNTLVKAPKELRASVCTIRDVIGMELDQTDFLITLLHQLEQVSAELRAHPGSLASRANSLCLQREQDMTVEQGGREIAGRCRGIAHDGALLLETSSGLRRVISGTVQ